MGSYKDLGFRVWTLASFYEGSFLGFFLNPKSEFQVQIEVRYKLYGLVSLVKGSCWWETPIKPQT